MITYPAPSPYAKPVVVIGNFDGVHAGHIALLTTARELGSPVVALTFEPHPRSVLLPEGFARLMTAEEKIVALKRLADDVALLPFDAEVAHWSPDVFMQRALVVWLGASRVVVGENFRFGHKAAGDVQTLKANPAFVTTILPLVKDAGGVVFSSSRLREKA